MKETLLQYAGFNVWANRRLIDTMLKLEPAQLEQEIVSSFSSIKNTVLHSWSAEHIWLQRLLLTEHPVWMETAFQGSFEEACAGWQQTSSEIQKFVGQQFNDAAFDHVLQYYSLKKQAFKSKVSEVLVHVFNHSTYHRGQLVTILRQAGCTQIPSTDFIVYTR